MSYDPNQYPQLLHDQGTLKKSPSKSASPGRPPLGYTCSLYKDYLYLFGGYIERDNQCNNQILIYSLIDNQWVQPIYENKPQPRVQGRYYHSATVYDNMIIFYGGMSNPRDRGLDSAQILAIDPESPNQVAWAHFQDFQEIQGGPAGYYQHKSHIYNGKMFIFNPNRFNLAFFNFKATTWNCNLIEEKVRPYELGDRIWEFSGSRLFGFPAAPDCQQSKYIQMLDLDSPSNWQQVVLPVDSTPSLYLSNIHTEMNGKIYVFGCTAAPRRGNSNQAENQLWSYETREDTWKMIEDSGSLSQLSFDQCTLAYKNRILTLTADVLECSIEILQAVLGEEDTIQQQRDSKDICKEKPEGFIKDSKDLFAGMLFTDVTFEVEDQHIPAHRSILAYRSQYFMNLFTEDQKSDKIKISDIRPHLFRAILQYIYCNEIELDEQLALDLLSILDRYSLENLRGICEKFLAAQIRRDNVISLLITADNYKIQKLKETCFRYVVKNLQNVSESDEIMELSKPLFLELLKFQNPPHHQPQEKKSEQKVDLTLDEIIRGDKKRTRDV